MQDLVEKNWDLTVRQHIGDIAWGRYSTGEKHDEWPTALWMEGESCVGWGWVEQPGELWFKVSRQHKELAGDILDWFEGAATGDNLTVPVLDQETELIAPLEARGYNLDLKGPFSLHTVLDLESLPSVNLPERFQSLSMADNVSPSDRARAHALAWSLLPFSEDGHQIDTPSKSSVTEELHRGVMMSWPYRPDLDRIILAPDGTPAACCICWYDQKNKVGELEPVGTHPEFRRLGLGRAVCLAALHKLKELGADQAIVYPRGDDAYPVPRQLYGSIGFKPYGRTVTYRLER